MTSESPAPAVPGSELVARWAAGRGMVFEARPDETWFRRWEPYDTMAPASHYYNSCTWQQGRLTTVLVEPWFADEGIDPLERTIVGFATHPGLVRRAAARAGEHFLTRVAFVESPPPPKVTVGDKLWDGHVATFAASGSEAAAAFHPALRRLLAGWGFSGHLELRPGGLVVHYAGLSPEPSHYERLSRIVVDIVNAALAPGR